MDKPYFHSNYSLSRTKSYIYCVPGHCPRVVPPYVRKSFAPPPCRFTGPPPGPYKKNSLYPLLISPQLCNIPAIKETYPVTSVPSSHVLSKKFLQTNETYPVASAPDNRVPSKILRTNETYPVASAPNNRVPSKISSNKMNPPRYLRTQWSCT